MIIRKATIIDAKSIASIYNYYVATCITTFAEIAITIEDSITNINNSILWLVCEKNNEIVGYAYASKWKDRCAYQFSVECSVYLKPNVLNKGIGTKLYTQLFIELKKLKLHTVIAGISLPNGASERLHENFGFKKVAHFKDVGYKFDQWIDVGYWQLIFNT